MNPADNDQHLWHLSKGSHRNKISPVLFWIKKLWTQFTNKKNGFAFSGTVVVCRISAFVAHSKRIPAFCLWVNRGLVGGWLAYPKKTNLEKVTPFKNGQTIFGINSLDFWSLSPKVSSEFTWTSQPRLLLEVIILEGPFHFNIWRKGYGYSNNNNNNRENCLRGVNRLIPYIMLAPTCHHFIIPRYKYIPWWSWKLK